MANTSCPTCRGKGLVKEEDGSVHICYECLEKGEFDQHSKQVKDTNLRL